MSAPSCSLSVVVNGPTMTFTYNPPDSIARTVWVDGQPTTIAPHDTATVPHADSYEYPTRGSWISTADTVAHCSVATTTSSTTTTQAVPPTDTPTDTPATVVSTTTTGPLSLVTIVRTTPEPTTTTALTSTPPTLPETGASSGDIATFGLGALCVVVGGAMMLAAWRRDNR